ncbi:MAG TPA: excinuclease ABC subunit UvrA, partial [Spirochaetota bacterium]|nr:excinuclease ABC subunit UvrA [Spirochaetota bacterium]
MSQQFIRIKGAREHNLKNISVDIPRERLVVITGLSGSGKSSLAFDTIYAEGQRRYVESLSAYARQFLGQMEKPDVDLIEGLSPAISIEQKTTHRNPRSTVGTVTEIHDYLRLLFARVGIAYCYQCGKPISSQTIDQIVENVLTHPQGTKVQVLAPVVRGRKGMYQDLFEKMKQSGYSRVRVDGQLHLLDDPIAIDKNKKHSIDVIIDRITLKENIRARLSDSIETAIQLAGGQVVLIINDNEQLISTKMTCPDCDISLPELSPRMFSFNSPYGACPSCDGLGFIM